jgi:biopolymer transport protein ExbB
MKIKPSPLFVIGSRALILAVVVVAWAVSRAATAQDDGGSEPVTALPDDGNESDSKPNDRDSAKSPPETPRGIPTTLSGIFRAGGPMMWPLAICSVVVLMFAIERQVLLRRRRVIPKDFVTRFLEHIQSGQIDRPGALALCEQNGSPIAEVFAHGVRKWGKPSVEVEQAIIDGGERQISVLRKHLRALNTVATIGPLIGLLGTVYGMINCFNEFTNNASAANKLDNLSIGIGQALIATAGGLCVAIPALVLYMYFAGRVDAVVIEMDLLAQKLVNLISAEALTIQAEDLPRIATPRPRAIGTATAKSS